MAIKVEVEDAGFTFVPDGSSIDVQRDAARKLVAEQKYLERLQTGESKLEGVSPEGEVLYPVMDGEKQEMTTEGRPVWENQYGEYVTERTVGVNLGGKEVNIPTVYEGRLLPIDEAIVKVYEASGNGPLKDPITGRVLEQYDSVEESNTGAQSRSIAIGEDIPEYNTPEDNTTEQEHMSEEEQLKFDEGVKYKSYEDSKGYLTAGVGHKLSKEEAKKYPKGTSIPKDVVNAWFKEDYSKARNDVDRVLKSKEINNVPSEVHSILTNMVFNLGPTGLKKFKDTFGFIKKGDYQAASEEMLDSQWYRDDVGPRAKRLSDRMAKVSPSQAMPESTPTPTVSPFEAPTADLQQSLEAQNNFEPSMDDSQTSYDEDVEKSTTLEDRIVLNNPSKFI